MDYLLFCDLFSSEFYFKFNNNSNKFGTIKGLLLSIITVTIILYYLSYLLNLFINNQINPKFRSQNFVRNDLIEAPISQDFLGFQYYYNLSMTIDQYQAFLNKAYVVFLAQYSYQDVENNIFKYTNLNVVKCTDPQLKGLYCVDISQISSQSLILEGNVNRYSLIQIQIYGCLDLDIFKTTVPNDCADQNEIDSLIQNDDSFSQLKLKTQQYKKTSKKIKQIIRMFIHTQIQKAQVSEGLVFQIKQSYKYFIQYNHVIQQFDKQELLKTQAGPYNFMIIQMDENYQLNQIQFLTITEVLALVNNLEFFMLVLRNLYSDKYQQIVQQNVNFLKQENPTSKDTIKLIEEKDEVDNHLVELNQAISLYKNNNLQPKLASQIYKQSMKSTSLQQISQQKVSPNQKKRFISSRQYIQQSIIQETQKKYQTVLSKRSKTPTLSMDKTFLSNFKIAQRLNIINDNSLKKTIQDTMFKLELSKEKAEDGFDQKFKKKLDQKSIISQIFNGYIKNQFIYKLLKDWFNNNSLKKTIQDTMFKFEPSKEKAATGLDQRLKNKIGSEVNNILNIQQFYKEFIVIKKATQMIFSQDQLAAIQFISLSDNFLNLNFNSNFIRNQYENSKNDLNYFEKQISILQSQVLKEKYMTRFIMKSQDNSIFVNF
ncbi:hypothetical protein ABPG72_004747 [Tetrahymena utriculariae]